MHLAQEFAINTDSGLHYSQSSGDCEDSNNQKRNSNSNEKENKALKDIPRSLISAFERRILQLPTNKFLTNSSELQINTNQISNNDISPLNSNENTQSMESQINGPETEEVLKQNFLKLKIVSCLMKILI